MASGGRALAKEGSPGGIVGSEDRAAVSICAILATTSSGAAKRWPVISSRIMERFVGRVVASASPFDVRKIDLSAALDFFTKGVAGPCRITGFEGLGHAG